MGRKWNHEGIPDDNLLPNGNMLVQIDDLQESQISGKCVFKTELTVTEPKSYKGRRIFLTYWCGSDEDPDWRDPKARSTQGAIDLKKLIRLTGVRLTDDITNDSQAALGRIVGVVVARKTRKDNSREDNIAKDYFKVGEREVEIFDGVGPKSAASLRPVSTKPQVAPRPAAPVATVEEDDEDDSEDSPVAAKEPPRRSTEGDVPKPGKPKKADMKQCPKCGESFARSALLEHLASCGDDDDDGDDDE